MDKLRVIFDSDLIEFDLKFILNYRLIFKTLSCLTKSLFKN